MNERVVFLQRRSHKAGAQTCLARLVRNSHIARYKPLVVCGEHGWFTEELARNKVEFHVERFPSSRSLSGRLWANRLFTRKLAQKLLQLDSRFLVHGNDHQDGILTISLARALGASSALFLRSPSMVKEDYEKYQCAEVDMAVTVSTDLMDRLVVWDPNKVFRVVSDGIYPEEVRSDPIEIAHSPRRFIILGSPLKWKGWRDIVDALCHLRSRGLTLAELSFDFTGNEPGLENDLDLGRLPGLQARFLGRRADFPSLLSDYDFAINPSRHETFGMAAVETIAFGLPLISSRTGVLGDLLDSNYLYAPGDVDELAKKLSLIIESQPPSLESLKSLQKNLLSRYNINDSAQLLTTLYEQQFT